MMRAVLVVAALAACLPLACAAAARQTLSSPGVAGSAMTAPRPCTYQAHPTTATDQALLDGARVAAQRVLTFLTNDTSATHFSAATVGRQL